MIAFAVQAAFAALCRMDAAALRRAPSPRRATAKKLLVLTLSLIETILQAVDRARTALIAAGAHHARGVPWRNLRQRLGAGADGVAHGDHHRDRPHCATNGRSENTLARLDARARRRARTPLSRRRSCLARRCGDRRAVLPLGLALMKTLIAGPNFSGRSDSADARNSRAQGDSFFIGPYAEAALSGLSSTVADEIAIYRAARNAAAFAPLDFAAARARASRRRCRAASRCCSRCIASRGRIIGRIGIDTALEQLDAATARWRWIIFAPESSALP